MLQIFEVRYNIGRYIYWILVVQGDWHAKVGRDACGNWQDICGPFCNDDTSERGLRLLEFATLNDLVLTNTFGHHKASRRWTWHSPLRKRFRSGLNSARTRKFSRSKHWKWSWPADDDLPPSPEKKSASQNTQDSSLTSKSWKSSTCWKPSKLW